MSFDHDSLLAHVVGIKGGTDMHGDEEKLAVDVKLRIHRAENEKPWPDLLRDIYGDDHQSLQAALERDGNTLAGVAFDAVHDDVKVNFRQSNRVVATLQHAKLAKFSIVRQDGAESLLLNVHAATSGKAIGAISEFLRKKLRIETAPMQSDLDLGAAGGEPGSEEEQTEDETEPA